MKKELPIYRASVEDGGEEGIFAMSFVEYPAIERNFVALSKKVPIYLATDNKKQVLTGAVLIPDQLIYRNDKQRGEHYIQFSASEIEHIALKMMKKGAALRRTTHQHSKKLNGNYLSELWIVKDPKVDKSIVLGLDELPAGSLVASYKIEDKSYWESEVMTGKVKGFSLEGLFDFKKQQMSKTNLQEKKGGKGIPAFFRSVAAFLEGTSEAEAEGVVREATKDETDSGTPYLIFDLSDGNSVWVDSDGFCTVAGGEQMPAGEHALSDGNTIVIDDNGQLVVTQPEQDSPSPSLPDVETAKKRGADFLKARTAKPLSAQTAQKLSDIEGINKRLAELEALQKKVAALELQPSSPVAIPVCEGSQKLTKQAGEMTYTEKMAAIIAGRRERQDAKK